MSGVRSQTATLSLMSRSSSAGKHLPKGDSLLLKLISEVILVIRSLYNDIFYILELNISYFLLHLEKCWNQLERLNNFVAFSFDQIWNIEN